MFIPVPTFIRSETREKSEIQKLRKLMDTDLVSSEAANRPLKRIKDVDGNPRNARLLNTSISSILNDVSTCISKAEVLQNKLIFKIGCFHFIA